MPIIRDAFFFILVALIFTATACGGGVQEPKSSALSLADKIEEFNSSVSYEWPLYSSALQTTPRTTFVVDGRAVGPVSDLFVIGRVTKVTAGNGYSWSGGPQVVGEPPNREVHKFNSNDSWLSTVHLSIAIENSIYLADEYSDINEITIGLFLLNPVNLNSLKTELEGKRIAAPLHSNEKTALDLEPGVFGVLRGGELLGFVDDSNSVTFPAFDHNQSPDSESQAITLEDLLNPPPVITISSTGNDAGSVGSVG
jgi:hypothetical protein